MVVLVRVLLLVVVLVVMVVLVLHLLHLMFQHRWGWLTLLGTCFRLVWTLAPTCC